MELFHTSPNKIEKINSYGTFDDCLFFSSSPYVMTAVEDYVTYTIEIDDDKVISVSDLYDESIISDISDKIGVDLEIAENLLDGSVNLIDVEDIEFDYENDYWIQAKRGECAQKMGYEACEDTDEQGQVWIVPMFGREQDLKEFTGD